MHHVRLENMNGFFQMDTLILSESFYMIIEVKNWQGTIIFSESGQVVRRTKERGEEGFQNPISQVKMQVYRLNRWLETNQLPQLPIQYLIVISSPSTIFKNTSANIPNE